MSSPVLSRRKWMLRSHGQHIVIVKGQNERFTHPLMKALLWALYIPNYPNISVEIHIGDKYKPDVIAYPPGLDLRQGEPVFWGEAGQTGREKIRSLVRRYKHTHFALAKWNTNLDPHIRIVQAALGGLQRDAPFDIINFAEGSAERFIDDDGHVSISHDALEWVRL